MAIKFTTNVYCSDCDEFEPCVTKERYTIDNDFLCKQEIRTETEVICKHNTRCQSIIRYLKEQMKKEIKNGRSEEV